MTPDPAATLDGAEAGDSGAIEIVRGEPDEYELAAVVAVLMARCGAAGQGEPAQPAPIWEPEYVAPPAGVNDPTAAAASPPRPPTR